MARARDASEWARTAAAMALLANVNRDSKRRRKPFEPDDFNPCVERQKQPARDLRPEELQLMREMFERGPFQRRKTKPKEMTQ